MIGGVSKLWLEIQPHINEKSDVLIKSLSGFSKGQRYALFATISSGSMQVSTGGWTTAYGGLHAVGYYSALNRKGMLTHATTGRNSVDSIHKISHLRRHNTD